MQPFFRAVIVPAAVFQSVIVGGAYGTGREVVEYVSRFGSLGGLLAIAVIAVAFSLVLALSFEFARSFEAWDYRRFLRKLLGRGWVLYEILFLALLIVILAITGAAAGNVLHDRFGIPPSAGTGVMFLMVVVLNYCGRQIVNDTLAIGAAIMIAVLVIYVGIVLASEYQAIAAAFEQRVKHEGWFKSGVTFAVYNSALIPVIVYCGGQIKTRGQAIAAGMLAALFAVFPALVFHVSFMAGYPDVIEQAVPTYWMIETLGFHTLLTIYVFVLFATVVQTGVGVLQGLNERLDGWNEERNGRRLSAATHAIVAGGLLLFSLVLAKVGIVDLVARGYGMLAWGFFVIFTLPLFTVGAGALYRRGEL